MRPCRGDPGGSSPSFGWGWSGALQIGLFGEDLFGPAEGRVGGGEADGGEGEDDGVHGLLLPGPDSEEPADVGADGSLGLCPDRYPELDQAPLLLAQRTGFVLRGS